MSTPKSHTFKRPLSLTLLTLLLALSSSLAFQSSQPLHVITKTKPNPFFQLANVRFALDVSNSENEEQSFISSVLYDGTYQGADDGLLSYLPEGGKTMPPKTRRLVGQVTSQYVYGIDGQPNLNPLTLLEVLESEYDYLPVSMVVGNQTFATDTNPGEALVVRLVSLAVLFQLPSEILLRMIDCAAATENHQTVREFKLQLEATGWDQVQFPTGLGIRMKRGIVSRTTQPSDQHFFPRSKLPWKSRSSRRAALAAQRGIQLVAQARAPEQTFRTKEEFITEIENEIHADPLSNAVSTESIDHYSSRSFQADALPSFPSERAWTKVKRWLMNPSYSSSSSSLRPKRAKGWRRITQMMDAQYQKLKGAGRAGLMAYAFMNFVIYTVGMAWQWRRIRLEAPLPVGATLVSLVMRKFVIAFTRVYVGAAVFKLGRIVVSLALAPAAGRVLEFTQRKLRVSENAALAILITLLVKTFVGTLAVVCLGDTALRTALQAAAAA